MGVEIIIMWVIVEVKIIRVDFVEKFSEVMVFMVGI
jgi:hypothetical protein